ncbi:MAG: prepilin-type N-terminal cleavage/methylation domain-containing protein [Gammaproteobacteria bacterium]|nr:MAG: prepilin-type N-terminal cleavage/methylation domain-containing protein [Gammaproteobacteria bacterium]
METFMESVVSQSAQNAGFTLIELMIVIVLMSIFVTVGVPSFQNTIRENRLSTQANELVSSLHFARSESIKRRLPISVCRIVNGFACVTVGTASWEQGWLVFIDTNSNGAVDGETILRSVDNTPDSTLRYTDSAAANNNLILFRSNGLLASTGGSFNLCNETTADTASGRNIRINVTGQVVTAQPATSCP